MKLLLLIFLVIVPQKGKNIDKNGKNIDINCLISIVEFHVRDDMEYALKKLNDRELNGQRVQLREVSNSLNSKHCENMVY